VRRRAPRKLSTLTLLAATYCMVAGGPYGLEDLIGKSGYGAALVILLVTPLLWSVPTALMVSELSSAIPEEGGYYVWVDRAMGPFWAFQEGWLSLVGSVFDMAIYPALFAAYVVRLVPALGAAHTPFLLGLVFVMACTAWNLLPARDVGRGSVLLAALALLPFAAVVGFAIRAGATATAAPQAAPIAFDLTGGIMIAMWNYMGWDNASTVAGEVDRPRTVYPRVMLLAVPLVTLSYLVPVGVMAHSGVGFGVWSTGGWVDAGRELGGPVLAVALMIGGALANFGTFNALVLSLTRLPAAMAEEGFLPRVLARRHPRTAVPVVSLLACAAVWGACQGLGFLKVVILDVLLSGLSMLLEFWALVVLRIREPGLRRPYRIPGGVAGCVAVGLGPAALIALSLVRTAREEVGAANELVVGSVLVAAGGLLYALRAARMRPGKVPQS